MVLGVMEGQIRGGYFPDYILDPSVIDYTEHSGSRQKHSKFNLFFGILTKTLHKTPFVCASFFCQPLNFMKFTFWFVEASLSQLCKLQ